MRKAFLPIALLCLVGMVACGGGTSSSSGASSDTSSESPSSSETSSSESTSSKIEYTLEISNKDALTAEWRVSEANRELSIAVTPAINITQAITKGDLVITSSEPTVVYNSGKMLSAVGIGTSTITVTYLEEFTDSVDIEVIAAKEYLTLDEVIAQESGNFTARGIYMGSNDLYYDSYGWNSIFLGDGETAYQLYRTKSDLVPEGLAIGDVLEVKGMISNYVSGGVTTYEATVSELMTIVEDDSIKTPVSLVLDAENNLDLSADIINRKVAINDATVTAKAVNEYGNVTLTFTVGGRETAYNLYLDCRFTDVTAGDLASIAVGDTFSTSTWAANKQFLYVENFAKGAQPDPTAIEIAAASTEVFIGYTNQLTISSTPANANKECSWASSDEAIATVDENGLVTGVAAGNVTITATSKIVATLSDTIDLTVSATILEPAYKVATLKEVIEDTATVGSQAYLTTVTLESWKGTNTDGTKYGNANFTDGTNTVVVYGCGASISALSFNGSTGLYSYKNATDFLTNEFTKNITIGDELDILCIRADYNGTVQISAVIRSVNSRVIPNAVLDTDAVQEVVNNDFNSYLVTGKITSFTTDPAHDGGRFNLKSEGATGAELLVYGCTANTMKYAIVASTGKAALTNPYDWNKNASTSAIAVGDTVTLICKRADYKETIEVIGVLYLTAAPTSITISGEATVEAGQTLALTSATLPVNADQFAVWSSSDEAIATVKNGVVTGVAAGAATITAAAFGDKAIVDTLDVTVTAKDVSKVTLTAEGLGIGTSYGVYTAEVDGKTWNSSEVMKGTGSSIQMRYKNSVGSVIANEDAMDYGIKTLNLNWESTAAAPADKADILTVSFGTTSACTDETINFSTVVNQLAYTVTPSVATYTFVKIAHTSVTGALYLSSIVLNLNVTA